MTGLTHQTAALMKRLNRFISAFGLGRLRQFGMGDAVVDAPEGGLHPVGNSVGQRIGPSGNGLGSYPDRTCSNGRCAAEQTNRFCLVHALLKHASTPNAIILSENLSSLPGMADPLAKLSPYARRVKELMDTADPPMSKTALADKIGVSFQAVSQLLTGSTKFFRADIHAKAARALSVDAYWLATGEGVRAVSKPETLSEVALALAAMFDTLTDPADRRTAWAINAWMIPRRDWPQLPDGDARSEIERPVHAPTAKPPRSR